MAGIIYRKARVVLNFKKDKPVVYKIAQVGVPPIEYEDMLEEIAQTQGCTIAQTKAVVNALINRSILFISNGHTVKLGELGTFKPTFRAKTVHNIEDADSSTVTAKVLRYYPGKELKDMMKTLPVKNASEVLNEE